MTAIGAKIFLTDPATGIREWGYFDPQTGTSGDILRKMHPEWGYPDGAVSAIPPPPINREDGGQTQLQEQNGVVSAVPQPTYPAINIPDVITPDFFNRPPSADRQRIENDLQTRRQEYMTSFQQTQREQQLQQETGDLETQLTNLRQSEAKGQFNIEQQRIAMPLITGQQAALQRQAQLERGDVLTQLESKQRSLGFEVAKREGIMAKAKAAIGFAESDLDRIGKLEQNQFEREKAILDYAQKLGDNARQILGTILSKFEGMGWNDLSEQARTGLANLAAQAGIDPFIIAQGLETQKDSMSVKQEKDRLENEKIRKELALPTKLETSITEAGGRRLLINDQTGEVIKDLGVSEIPKAGVSETGFDTDGLVGVNKTLVDSFNNAVIGLPAKQMAIAQKTFKNYINSGDTEGAKSYLIRVAMAGATADQQNQAIGRKNGLATMTDVKQLLDTAKQRGASTNLLTGSLENVAQKLGATSNPDLAYIGSQIQQALQVYRRSMTGVAFSPNESAEYAKIFPDITNLGTLNSAKISSLIDSFNRNNRAVLSFYIGDNNYDQLFGKAVAPELPSGQQQQTQSATAVLDSILQAPAPTPKKESIFNKNPLEMLWNKLFK